MIKAFTGLSIAFLLAISTRATGRSLAIVGAPADTGYNLGTTVAIRATLRGTSDAAGYAVFADIQYVGTTSVTSVEMDAQPGGKPDEIDYQANWPLPPDAPTGLYRVNLRVESQSPHRVVATYRAPSFFAYRKLIAITSFALNKAVYSPGEQIQCEATIRNLTNRDLPGLRIEFSNENYPWISTFSGRQDAAGKMAVNPSLGLVTLRDSQSFPAGGEIRIPMEPAGTAAFLQGAQVAVMGAGGPARHFAAPPPEVDRYTLAVWNHDRTELYDMQFSPQVIVREPTRLLPKPYNRNYTHPYNDDIDFTRYREFYPPEMLSRHLHVDRSHTLYRPGDVVTLNLTAQNTAMSERGELEVSATIQDPSGRRFKAGKIQWISHSRSGETDRFAGYRIWTVPRSAVPGVYTVTLTLRQKNSQPLSETTTELAVNNLPASLLVFCPHEDDEHPWAGLMRAMVEAGRPVRVVFFTGGDVGECERYFDGHPCDPIRAREFGMVRMEESVEALQHIGVDAHNVIFLGLPDGGSGEIWFHHGATANPFLDIYLGVDHAPYENAYQPNLPYARNDVIDAVKKIIKVFRPSVIAAPHPDERHVDHRTANWFVVKAAQELVEGQRIDPNTVVLADRAYGSGGYRPAPYHYEKYVVYLSGEAAALKQEMGWIYQSQDGNLEEGAKKTFAELPREELHYRILDWQQHPGWNE
jgi:LmbE family N-acetylglucosaminyl deacetylase